MRPIFSISSRSDINVTLREIFNRLDLNKNGKLSRSELHESARRMGWYWNEAPILAVFDLLTVREPISEDNFIAFMAQIITDPLGPFGKVLLNSPHFLPSTASKRTIISERNKPDVHKMNAEQHRLKLTDKTGNDTVTLLKHFVNLESADNHFDFLRNMESNSLEIGADNAAVLIIDPQRSFTKGVWMASLGSDAEREVQPIRLAFEKCARFLKDYSGRIETMFTRCPFPPCSYDWDDVFTGIIDPKQLYFIKPGNSVLFPATNGFRQWVESVIEDGKETLVIAGCTLNSCVRVSSIETNEYFKNRGLQIVVDLSMSGARSTNFIPSSQYNGLSAVEVAVREMIGAGIRVSPCIRWV